MVKVVTGKAVSCVPKVAINKSVFYNRALDKWEVANHYNMGRPHGYPEASVD